MPPAKAGRTILAVVAGYGANAVLVGVTEAIYVKFLDGYKYFMVDLLTQIIATIVGGWLCCLIAQRRARISAVSLTILGLVIGTVYGFPAPPISRRDEEGFSSCLA
jgi:hypothetical protein